MVLISTDIEIKGEDMEKFLAGIVVHNPGQSLANIAAQFLCSRPNLENLMIGQISYRIRLKNMLSVTHTLIDIIVRRISNRLYRNL